MRTIFHFKCPFHVSADKINSDTINKLQFVQNLFRFTKTPNIFEHFNGLVTQIKFIIGKREPDIDMHNKHTLTKQAVLLFLSTSILFNLNSPNRYV